MRKITGINRFFHGLLRENIFSLCVRYALLCAGFCRRKWLFLVSSSLSSEKKRLLYLFIIGLFNFFASPPFSVIVVLPLTFGSLMYIIEKQKCAGVFALVASVSSFLFGYFVSLFWWLFVPLTTDFASFFWLIPFAIFGLPFAMTLCFVPFFAIGFFVKNKFEHVVKKYNDICLLAMFLVCWFCGEYVRGHVVFGGFPWMFFGHFVKYAFAFQIVRLIGIDAYSVLFLVFVLSFYFFLFKKRNHFTQLFCLVIFSIWIINFVVGFVVCCFAKHDSYSQAIIGTQINYPASLDLSNHAIDILNKNISFMSWTAGSKKDMIKIMPENGINFSVESGSSVARKIGKVVGSDGSILLAGGIYSEGLSLYNVVYSFDNGGNIVALYKKQILVPFGEYIPVRRFMPFLTRTLTNGMVDFSTDGENDLFIFYRDLPIIYPVICYESIFPNYVINNIKQSREYIREKLNELKREQSESHWGAEVKTLKERGELIVNVVNDAWMKWSVAGYQHFLMTRYLAVATGVPVVRVSNNGFSVFIDSRGRVIKQTKLNEADVLFIPGDASKIRNK